MTKIFSIADFLDELDEHFTRDDLVYTFPPVLESLKELVPMNDWKAIDRFIERVYAHAFDAEEDDQAAMLFWGIISEFEYQLMEIGTYLVPRSLLASTAADYEVVEGYPELEWLGKHYRVAVEL